MSGRPAPSTLWAQAEGEHPTDPAARRARYRELMLEHGHLRLAEPGESSALPCGWKPGVEDRP